MSNPAPRSVIEQPRYQQEARGLFGTARNSDAALRGILAVIARNPQAGSTVGNAGLWYASADGMAITPLVVFYRFDDEKLYLESVIPEMPDSD